MNNYRPEDRSNHPFHLVQFFLNGAGPQCDTVETELSSLSLLLTITDRNQGLLTGVFDFVFGLICLCCVLLVATVGTVGSRIGEKVSGGKGELFTVINPFRLH